MLKKPRKRSWQTHYARVPLYKHEDIIYPKSYSFNERFQECVAFLKKKSVFVKIVKNRDDLDWEPVSNQYMVKIYGRLEVDGQIYLLMQNVGKSSVRDII